MSKKRRFSSIIAILLFWMLLFHFAASTGATEPRFSGKGPRHGVQGLGSTGEMQINDEDRCPVCAMKVANYPKFSCAIRLADQRTFYFCGNGCMIRSWLHPEVFLGVSKKELISSVVRDYFSGEQVDAATVTWIIGSDVIGPMGPMPVPLRNKADVDTFKKRHGGQATFFLPELTDRQWESMTGRNAVTGKKK